MNKVLVSFKMGRKCGLREIQVSKINGVVCFRIRSMGFKFGDWMQTKASTLSGGMKSATAYLNK